MAKGNGELVTRNFDAFVSYGQQAATSGGNIVGDLLLFTKGEYVAGQGKDEVAEDTRVVVNMDTMIVGWQRWENKKPVEQIMGLLFDAFQPPPRTTLGRMDDKEWEMDVNGKPIDPWQFTNQFICKDEADSTVYTFATSSRGGIGAIGTLTKAYGEQARTMKQGAMPVIELGVDSYPHKEYGKTYVPVFPIVDWSSVDIFDKEDKPAKKAAPKNPVKKLFSRRA